MGRFFFSSGTNRHLAHTAREQDIRVCLHGLNQPICIRCIKLSDRKNELGQEG